MKQKTNGFSVIEVVLVLLIVGILVTMSSGGFQTNIFKAEKVSSESENNTFQRDVLFDCGLENHACGENLVANNHFADSSQETTDLYSYWDYDSHFKIHKTFMQMSLPLAGEGFLYVPARIEDGAMYRVDFQVSDLDGPGEIGVAYTEDNQLLEQMITTGEDGHFSFVTPPLEDLHPYPNMRLYAQTPSSLSAVIDNVSVRKIQ